MGAAVTSNPALIPGIGAVKPSTPAAAPGRALGSAPSGGPALAPSGAPAFAEVLKQAGGSQPLHFSRHALERVQRRGIALDPTTLARLNEGVGRAAGKGSRDSVVLVDGTAFVVSVANRTVLTAVDQQHMCEHVFTNIDSAVLA
jgi:flagellar operon protein